jgi:hypothetical protein
MEPRSAGIHPLRAAETNLQPLLLYTIEAEVWFSDNNCHNTITRNTWLRLYSVYSLTYTTDDALIERNISSLYALCITVKRKQLLLVQVLSIIVYNNKIKNHGFTRLSIKKKNKKNKNYRLNI